MTEEDSWTTSKHFRVTRTLVSRALRIAVQDDVHGSTHQPDQHGTGNNVDNVPRGFYNPAKHAIIMAVCAAGELFHRHTGEFSYRWPEVSTVSLEKFYQLSTVLCHPRKLAAKLRLYRDEPGMNAVLNKVIDDLRIVDILLNKSRNRPQVQGFELKGIDELEKKLIGGNLPTESCCGPQYLEFLAYCVRKTCEEFNMSSSIGDCADFEGNGLEVPMGISVSATSMCLVETQSLLEKSFEKTNINVTLRNDIRHNDVGEESEALSLFSKSLQFFLKLFKYCESKHFRSICDKHGFEPTSFLESNKSGKEVITKVNETLTALIAKTKGVKVVVINTGGPEGRGTPTAQQEGFYSREAEDQRRLLVLAKTNNWREFRRTITSMQSNGEINVNEADARTGNTALIITMKQATTDAKDNPYKLSESKFCCLVADLLKVPNIDLTVTNQEEETAISIFAKNLKPELQRLLLKKLVYGNVCWDLLRPFLHAFQGDVNEALDSASGKRLLHIAAQENRLDLVEYLVLHRERNRADPRVRCNGKKKRPVDYAPDGSECKSFLEKVTHQEGLGFTKHINEFLDQAYLSILCVACSFFIGAVILIFAK